ncbi:MAG: hypothetical protein HYW22_00535 [Candidatus Aenigmarchaeota archaeon]|nr:hypothetical protein [Candidatus Aenigmarchaeota archaeon]
MSDIASDHDAVISLIIQDYRRLQRLDPAHELLGFITGVDDEGYDFVQGRWREFRGRFYKPNDKYIVEGKARYWIGLRDAADALEKSVQIRS